MSNTARAEQSTQTSPMSFAPGQHIADPAPLGLAAFALTTFLLSMVNAGWCRTPSSEPRRVRR